MSKIFETVNDINIINKINEKIDEMLVLEYDNNRFYCNYIKKDFLLKNNFFAYPINNADLMINNIFAKLGFNKFYLIGISEKIKPINKDNYMLEFSENNRYIHFKSGYVYIVNVNLFNINNSMFWGPTSYFMFSSLGFEFNIIYSVEELYGIIFLKNELLDKLDNLELKFLNFLQNDLRTVFDKVIFYDLDFDKPYIEFITKLKDYYEFILQEQGIF